MSPSETEAAELAEALARLAESFAALADARHQVAAALDTALQQLTAKLDGRDPDENLAREGIDKLAPPARSAA